MKKICVAASAGGHTSEALALKEAYGNNWFLVTAKRKDTEGLEKILEKKVYRIMDPEMSLFRYGINFLQSFFIFLKENPDIVITTGAGNAFGIVFLARLFNRKIIFIESIARIDDLGKFAKFIYKKGWYDVFLVQWKNLVKKYPKTKYFGRVI